MSGPTLIQSVQRALRLLEVVAERSGRVNAKELARAVGLPLPTTYHLLRTLAHEEYLQRLDDGSYVLGHRLDRVLAYGAAPRALAQARPALEQLRDQLGSAVYLALYADGEIHIVEIADGPKTPRIDLWVGIHDAAHATALGKSILGQLPASERDEYLANHPLHDLTPHTVVDRCKLRLPRPDGVAVDDQEYTVGIRCLASPVTAPGSVAGGSAAGTGRSGTLSGAIGFVTTARSRRDPPWARRTLAAGSTRVSRALTLG